MPAVVLQHERDRSLTELETITTPFNTVRARRIGARVDLDVEGATFATWHPQRCMTGYSWDALSVAALLGPKPPSSVLVLGLGGGTTTRQLRQLLPQVRLVGVEIDAGVIELARRHMDLDSQRLEVHVTDAYAFLADSTEHFDVIMDDLFLCGPSDVVRTRIPQGETLALFQKRLTASGVVVANLITDVGEHATVRAATRAAFCSAFASVRVVVPPRGLNEVLVGGAVTRPRSSLAAYHTRLLEAYDRQRLTEIVVKPVRAGVSQVGG